MVRASLDPNGSVAAGALSRADDRTGNGDGVVTEGERWRSLRAVLDVGGPWAIVASCGTIRAASAHLRVVGEPERSPRLQSILDAEHREPISQALAAVLTGWRPVRLSLRPSQLLGEGVVAGGLVFTPWETGLDGAASVVVQFTEAPPSHIAPDQNGDRSREAELEAALKRVHALVLQASVIDEDERCVPMVAEPLPHTLSMRRRQVAVAVLEGGSVEAIALDLGLSPHTVRNHLKAVYRQLGISSRAELQRRFHP